MTEPQTPNENTDSLKELLERRRILDTNIAQVFEDSKKKAILDCINNVNTFNIKPSDIFTKNEKAVKPKIHKKVAAKYKDPNSDATWTGRGKKPRWVTGDLSNYAITKP